MPNSSLTRCAAAVLALLTVAAGPLAAQRRPTSGGAASPATTAAVNPEVVALANAADLAVDKLGFNALGEVSFSLQNRGAVGVNVPDARQARSREAVPDEKRIRIDVYVNDGIVRTVYEQRIKGRQAIPIVVKLPPQLVPRCAASRPLKVVVDGWNAIAELHDDNNSVSLVAERPCPDLAIESIEKNYNSARTEFVAEVTLINRGNIESPRFGYVATTSSHTVVSPLPDLDLGSVEQLGPGEKFKFRIGNAFAYDKLHVFVLLDRFREVDELVESNNSKEKTLH